MLEELHEVDRKTDKRLLKAEKLLEKIVEAELLRIRNRIDDIGYELDDINSRIRDLRNKDFDNLFNPNCPELTSDEQEELEELEKRKKALEDELRRLREEESIYDSNKMPAPDSQGCLSKEEIYQLGVIGVIATEPKQATDPEEYFYDRPGSDIWAWRNRRIGKAKKPLGDDGQFYFEDLPVRSWVNWSAKLSLHDPGVVDPIASR
jgi:single-stranded DNA-specific DHH superfamily exonuclease